MQAAEILAGANTVNVVVQWDDAHRYTPAPRHRRRLILGMLRDLEFTDCLDAGCAQPFLLRAIVERNGVAGYGCDISEEVIVQNRRSLPVCTFQILDLTREVWPGGRRFDLVVCSEVLEHLADWQVAVASLVQMARKQLLITVPSGPIRPMDQMVGHLQHFQGPELCAALEANGCTIEKVCRWGFPWHSLYKRSISALSPAQLYSAFSGGRRYGLGKRLLSHALNFLFYANVFNAGSQLFVQARRRACGGGLGDCP
jgi:SAM-dependent methyltransferase